MNLLALVGGGGDNVSMFPAFLGILLLVLPSLPIWMRSVYRRSALLGTPMQTKIFWGFQVCLALSVFLAFFLTWFSFSVTNTYLAPYLTGLDANRLFWDQPLTPRGFLLLLCLLGVPYFVFSKVGLVSIRDAHQVCKEQRDRLGSRRKSAHWKGF